MSTKGINTSESSLNAISGDALTKQELRMLDAAIVGEIAGIVWDIKYTLDLPAASYDRMCKVVEESKALRRKLARLIAGVSGDKDHFAE